jgi:hypothetical protein
MDTFGLHVATKQFRDFSIFNASNVSKLDPSTRWIIAANICKSLVVFNKHISLEDTFAFA